MACWFGNMFHQVKLELIDSTWRIEENLTAKTMISFLPHEATAVYRCIQLEPKPGEEAVVKIHMQIPHKYGLSAEELASQASTTPNITVTTEIKFLTHLTRNRCSSTPKLLCHSQIPQPDGMCLPGGYLVFMLMERLPGKTILDFWDYDLETRNRIREAFKSSWMEMNKACVHHGDSALRNILWDEVAEKCYIIDFEDAEFIDKPSSWPRHEFLYWELVKHTRERGETVAVM